MLDDSPAPVPPNAGTARERRGIFRRLRKLAFCLLAILLGAILLYCLFAVILGLIPVNSDYQRAANGTEVFVETNGIHTDFVLPLRTQVKAWTELIRRSGARRSQVPARYLSFGWGDRSFYLNTPDWSDFSLGTAFNAVLLPSETVMHVTFLDDTPELSDTCRRLVLDEEQFSKLVRYIERGFARDDTGGVKRLPEGGYWKNDDFYEATGSYHLFNTCNDWANMALKEIGVRTALWAPFDKAIFYHLPKD